MVLENAGMLRPGAPVPTDQVGRYFSRCYELIGVAEAAWLAAHPRT